MNIFILNKNWMKENDEWGTELEVCKTNICLALNETKTKQTHKKQLQIGKNK